MLTFLWKPFHALELAELHDLLQLRSEIFVVEQTCAYLDVDGRDPHAYHLLVHDDDGLVAYLRAFPPGADGEAVIGRVVVRKRARGQGWGGELMREGHRRVWSTWGPRPIAISAQAYLERFYGELGYRVTGPAYDEDGIPHLPMRLEPPESASGGHDRGV